jgi:serine/threonine-protein kinase
MKRFRREAEAVGRLSHPGIVSVYELGESYIALELVEGESLAALLARRGRLPPEQALPVLAAIAGALDHVHARGVVHRDVKPSNVLVASSGGVKVTDFGTAHLAWAPMTRTGELIGSPAYMAPEQIVRGGIQPASDVYALGVVAFETLTGTLPFRGRNLGELLMRIAVEPPPSARGPNPALPPGVDLVLARAFAKDPGHRFQSARNMVAALEAAFGEGGGTARGLVEGLLLAGTSLLGPW